VEALAKVAEPRMKVFLPMDGKGQPTATSPTTAAPELINRRKYTRHRYSTHVEIRREQGLDVDAMTFEIREGGMSAATPNILAIGEKVEIRTIAGQMVEGVVRRKHGSMYGFEFVGISEGTREKIREICRGLPPFMSMLDL
jgi:c-di-GMP-binding flagellar brake protein YcgR